MIERLKIERFKSIRSLAMECRRINLFIGEPNVGKSNILEALGVLSWCGTLNIIPFKNFVRFQSMQHIFYDCLIDEPIRIALQGKLKSAETLKTPDEILGRSQEIEKKYEVTVQFKKEHFTFGTPDLNSPPIAKLDYNGGGAIRTNNLYQAIKFYRYISSAGINSPDPASLIPPNGNNLFSVVYGSQVLRDKIAGLFEPYGLMAAMKPQTREFAIQKHEGGIVTEIPYESVSDTLQRVMFYEAAMVSNKDSVLVFEEPEAHAFPFYTKHLGEQLALDETNQYFIATHNPYLLSAVVEKAKKDEVGVFVTYWENHETKVKMLTGDELSRLMDADPFLSIEGLLSGEGE